MREARAPFLAVATVALLSSSGPSSIAQTQNPVPTTDVTTPLHEMRPNYKVPYGIVAPEAVAEVMKRVFGFLESNTPISWIDVETGKEVSDPAAAKGRIEPKPGAFRLMSYEWGVVYSAMLRAGEATGDPRYPGYVASRLKVLDTWARRYHPLSQQGADSASLGPIRQLLRPAALDDSGAMAAAMIKATRAKLVPDLRPWIDNYLDWVGTKQFRLTDGTLARNRPQPNTLWLDDLYMGIPALSQMGALTGERKYFDDSVKQVQQYAARMFNKDLGLFIHGWVQGMEPHPQIHWARANGWAILAMSELLDVLPQDHPGRASVLEIYRAHAAGLARVQGGLGFWHQILNRTDSYLETSATAIFSYSIAHGINKGWLDPLAYGPMALLGWQAVATKVNSLGQVEGTCVGTGMAFDPSFYHHRPIHVFAAHGYGPTLMAGAEIIDLIKRHRIEMNDSSVQFYRK
jgi:unsaturated rhamnogalacturonyl hydrolase